MTITPVASVSGFQCPCHGGAYDAEGNRVAGPPVRALDRYEFMIKNGNLVLGKRYSVGKVEGKAPTRRSTRTSATTRASTSTGSSSTSGRCRRMRAAS